MRLKPVDIIITTGLTLLFCSGCGLLSTAAKQQVANISMEAMDPVMDQKIDQKLTERVPIEVKRVVKEEVSNIVVDNLPWIIAILASGGGAATLMRMAKERGLLKGKGLPVKSS